jgi:hypothetical protein
MNKLLMVRWLVICALAIVAQYSANAEEMRQDSKRPAYDVKWNNFIKPLSSQRLWSERDAYDASHIMMVPMHYAFYIGDKNKIADYENLMMNFSRNELPGGQLNQVQWMYLVSRYIVLKYEHNLPIKEFDESLVARLINFIYAHWRHEPSFVWGWWPMYGLESYINYIVDGYKKRGGYYFAVTDYHMFYFAIVSDMKSILNKRKDVILDRENNNVKDLVNKIYIATLSLFKERSVFLKDGGWLWQVGVWADHPDYRYAGHSKLKPNLTEMRVPDVAEDSSHSHRWPLWYVSMINAAGDDKEKSILLQGYCGLSRQFKNKVVNIRGRYLRLNNYADGRNGVYRYKFATVGENEKLGYGPYHLSGVLGESWYYFLNGVDGIFDGYHNSYPLSKEAVDLYTGPNTTRERNPYFVWPDYFKKGFSQMVAYHGYVISRKNLINCDGYMFNYEKSR